MSRPTSRLLFALLGLAVAGTVAVGQDPPVPLLTVRRQDPNVTTSQQSGTVYTNTFDAPSAAANNTGTYTSYGFAGPGGATQAYTSAAPGFGVFNDQYGGSALAGGGQDNYFSTGNRVAPGGGPFLSPTTTLTLSQTAYYLGIHWMATDPTNSIRLYRGTTLVDRISAEYVLADVGLLTNPGYNGTDKRALDGTVSRTNVNEKYAFINIYAKDASQGFDRVEFDNSTGGSGFESDNHTLGFDLIDLNLQAGIVLVPVPEPAGLLAAAGGLLVVGRRLRRG